MIFAATFIIGLIAILLWDNAQNKRAFEERMYQAGFIKNIENSSLMLPFWEKVK
jgi:hypothetical protein